MPSVMVARKKPKACPCCTTLVGRPGGDIRQQWPDLYGLLQVLAGFKPHFMGAHNTGVGSLGAGGHGWSILPTNVPVKFRMALVLESAVEQRLEETRLSPPYEVPFQSALQVTLPRMFSYCWASRVVLPCLSNFGSNAQYV